MDLLQPIYQLGFSEQKRLLKVITIIFLSRPLILFYAVHARTMEFFEFLERLPQRYYSLALAQITINFTFAGQCLIEIEFLFYPQVIIIPFKNCIVDVTYQESFITVSQSC